MALEMMIGRRPKKMVNPTSTAGGPQSSTVIGFMWVTS